MEITSKQLAKLLLDSQETDWDPREVREMIVENPDNFPIERLQDFITQGGNPYGFRCGEMLVYLRFGDDQITLEKCFIDLLVRRKRQF